MRGFIIVAGALQIVTPLALWFCCLGAIYVPLARVPGSMYAVLVSKLWIVWWVRMLLSYFRLPLFDAFTHFLICLSFLPT